LIECANNGGDHVHQFKVLSFQISGEQAVRIGSQFEESAVKQSGEFSADRPNPVE
jgi:uncharacterized RmlC-like cupin family protein